MGSGKDPQRVDLADNLAGQRVQIVQRLDLVAEELDANRQLFVGGDDLDGVAAHPKRAASKGHVVSGVLHVDQQPQQPIARHFLAHLQLDGAVQVGLRCAQAVDAGHRSHHHHVTTRQQRRGRGVPQPLHVVVDGAILFDISVGLRDIRLRLVVVVVRDEVLDGVVRQHLSQFVRQLGGQRLVGRHHQGGPLQAFDQPRGGRRLPGAGGAEQHHVTLPRVDPPLQLVDCGRLVAGRSMRTDHLEVTAGAHNLLDRAILRMRDHRMLGSESHANQPRATRGHTVRRACAECHQYRRVDVPARLVRPDRVSHSPTQARDVRPDRPHQYRSEGHSAGGR
ncbi:Uncharacterised protein [Mycobacterium tuberculosis]|nr:Uncharacterised protein [Mycobacterium tuberculosis]CNM27788.1 Uncharacterised protein [Mycobacterium tuberculosis]COV08562.1 Uncharacterised protein [Mycobacterium tuberculosis]